MSRFTRSVCGLLTLCGLAASVSAQCGAIKLTATTPTVSQRIGDSMAWFVSSSSGDQRLLAGAPRADSGAALNGGIVKYFGKVGSQWGELAELRRPGQAANADHFGASVASNGAQIIVGAPGVQADSGAAYIFEFQGTWTSIATITPAQSGNQLGTAVAMAGDFAFIGTPGFDTTNNAGSGQVLIYKRNAQTGAWAQNQTVSDTAAVGLYVNRGLGSALAADDNVLVIGAPNATSAGMPSGHGMVRIMRRNPSTGVYSSESAEFAPANSKSHMAFGSAVATDGIRIAVGAPSFSATSGSEGFDSSQCGAVWVLAFRSGGWAIDDQIVSPLPTTQGYFGSNVSINGDRLLVSQPGDKKAMAFRRMTSGGWALERVYSDEDTASSGSFGSAVAIGSGNHFISDAMDDSPSSKTDAGAIYIKPLPSGYADSCEAAYTMTGSTMTGCTLEASPDLVPLCGAAVGTATGKGVWVRYVPTQTGAATFTTLGSSFDTVLSVHSTCPTTAADPVITCNDDTTGIGNASSVSFDAVAGTAYLINVRGFSIAAGTFVLNSSLVPYCPADWNHSGVRDVQDVFDFLDAWFIGTGDFDGDGQRTVQDIFDFLDAWFMGC